MNLWLNVAGAFLTCLAYTTALPDEIKIGGLFHPNNGNLELAFRQAVDRINADGMMLPRSKLVAQIEHISPFDSFQAGKRVCGLLNVGVAAIFGPKSTHTASHVQSICENMQIPHLENRWDYRLRRESFLINLYPHPNTLALAYADIIRFWGWKSFTIIYENNDGLVRLQELFKDHGTAPYSITTHQLSDSGVYRPLLQKIKNSAESNIVLDCSTDKVYEVLKQAQQVGMMSDYHNYLITSPDLHTINLDEFRYGGTNITGFRLVNEKIVNEVVRQWSIEEKGVLRSANLSTIRTETALMYDAVHLFAKALHDLDTSHHINIHPLSCDGQNTWQHGFSLINYMKMLEMKGLTNVIKFDHQGFRSDFILDIVELSPGGMRKIGTWNSTMNNGINFTRTFSQKQQEIEANLKNKTLIVTTILSNPYCMRKESADSLSGNDQFEGYGVDLIHEISKALGFSYKIQPVPDGSYGSFNKQTGEWNGMINELLKQRADLAIADLTITAERQKVIDFSTPFMNLGISILYHKPVTTRDMDASIESVEDLAKQTKIKYGAVYGGSTAAFFKNSNILTYQRMWGVMASAQPSVFARSKSEGIERVVNGKGKYAFLMESPVIEYAVERNCNLTQVGGTLNTLSYGIAMPLNSPYRISINSVILKLQEEGRLHILKSRWWQEKRGGGICRVG